jgi:hypothetical protein
MGRTILGIVLAAVAVFFWGYLFWGLNPLPYTSWKQSTGDEAAQAALREHFPEDGTYFIPSPMNPEVERLHLKGPVAFLNIKSGGPMMDSSAMIGGLLQNLLVATVLLALLKLVPSAISELGSQIKYAALFGLVAALLIDLGDVVWWFEDVAWKLHMAFYHITSFVIFTVVLCRFSMDRRE